ncbi:MAG TPA: UDP-galactopyranose mutase [Bacteroidales bacterium]|nr:UDP-galactopyranose mutase [Bacteroidales bacterium]
MDISGLRYLIVGSGFFGSVLAERIANVLKEKVLVIEKRDHVGGNCFSADDPETGIHYHLYGTHIFHTPNEKVWKYINNFTEFNSYYHQVLTVHRNKVYQMPVNLETINSFYNINLKPFEVDGFLRDEVKKEKITNPRNFEEKAISMMGRPLYEAFFKGYTLKQWQKDPREMPESVLKRLPFRNNYNESYYNSRWQGIPLNGYGRIFDRLLENRLIDVKLNTDYFDLRGEIPPGTKVIYSGPIDRFFNFKFGRLEYRTLKFEKEIVPVEDFQGTSVMNYADVDVPYTRIHEPRHLHPERTDYPKDKTMIIREYSMLDDGTNPYYPINDDKNQNLVLKYREASHKVDNVLISGRLGDYKYYDMHDTINHALEMFEQIRTQASHDNFRHVKPEYAKEV